MRSFREWRERAHDDGLSLAELLVSMMIFSLLMAMVMSIMITLTNMSKDSTARAQAIQEARLGLSQIDRQVRSGNVILDPANEDPSNSGVGKFFSLRIFTQEGMDPKCAQWRVIDHDGDGFGDLQYRTWDPAWPSVQVVSSWASVAHNLIEMEEEPPTSIADIDPDDPTTWPPFWVNSDVAGGTTAAQSVSITLRLKDPSERPDAKPTTISSTVTGRNTVFGYPNTSCSKVPNP